MNTEEIAAETQSDQDDERSTASWAKPRRRPLSMTPELWPEPTMDEPDLETLEEWFMDSVCEATDSCIVEHDGCCPHGYPSWFLYLGLI